MTDEMEFGDLAPVERAGLAFDLQASAFEKNHRSARLQELGSQGKPGRTSSDYAYVALESLAGKMIEIRDHVPCACVSECETQIIRDLVSRVSFSMLD